MKTANDFYTSWVDTQMSVTKNWMDTINQAAKPYSGFSGFGDFPGFSRQGQDFYSSLLDSQTKTMKNWVDATVANAENAQKMFSGMMPQFSNEGAKEALNFYQQWLQLQADFTQQWVENARKTQEMMGEYANVGALSANALGRLFKLYDSWKLMTNSWNGSAEKAFGNIASALTNGFPTGIAQETFKNMLNASNAYVKLLEFWMPMFKTMQERPGDLNALRELATPARYKEVLDRVFESVVPKPELIKSFFEQLHSFSKSLNTPTQEYSRQLAEMLQSNMTMLAELAGGNPEYATNLYNGMIANYQRAFEFAGTLSGTQKEAEAVKLTSELFQQASEYATSLWKFQSLLYTAGQETMEEMVDKAVKTAQKGEPVKNYDEFFKLWIDLNEQSYNSVFKSKEFTAAQGELAKMAAGIRKQFQNLMELFLEEYPVVLRSEIDELYKSMQDIKSKMRTNGSAHDEEKSEKTTAKKATAKK